MKCPVTKQSTMSSKFFGRPNGSVPKPQQSTLAFQQPTSSKAAKTEGDEKSGQSKLETDKEPDDDKTLKAEDADNDVDMDGEAEAVEHKAKVQNPEGKSEDSMSDVPNEATSTLPNGKYHCYDCFKKP